LVLSSPQKLRIYLRRCNQNCRVLLWRGVTIGVLIPDNRRAEEHNMIYVMYSKKLHNFQIKISIQFLVFSVRFEYHVFTIRKTICTGGFFMVCVRAEIRIKGYTEYVILKCENCNFSMKTHRTKLHYRCSS
jgi:RNase P subunit RPR2